MQMSGGLVGFALPHSGYRRHQVSLFQSKSGSAPRPQVLTGSPVSGVPAPVSLGSIQEYWDT